MRRAPRESFRTTRDPDMDDAPTFDPSSSQRRSQRGFDDALADQSSQRRGKRDLSGCLTCRVRRKKCPGSTGNDEDCDS